jgi:murein DD-endopeptidase MepM/ murein hydrolase activator NlpD
MKKTIWVGVMLIALAPPLNAGSWFPVVESGAGWKARLTLANRESVAAEVRIETASPSGESFALTLSPGETRVLDSSELGSSVLSMHVLAPDFVTASLVIESPDGRVSAPFFPIADLSETLDFVVPASETSSEQALILWNPGDGPVRVELGFSANESDTYQLSERQTASIRLPRRRLEEPERVRVVSDEPVAATILVIPSKGSPELIAPRVSTGTPWLWPIAPASDVHVGQDYAEFGLGDARRFHTALDIGAPRGRAVRSAASGEVVKIQLNGGCTATCEDHGFGNTIIVRHFDTLIGTRLHTQYSHLDAIDSQIQSACGSPEPGKTKRITCRVPVPVGAGQFLGTVGRTGYGRNYWNSDHLHFEVKSFPALAAGGDDGPGFGYTDVHPDLTGGNRYFDPFLKLHDVELFASPVPAALARNALLYVGPGGRGDISYRWMASLTPGETYDAVASTSERDGVYCGGGWIQIKRRGGLRFLDSAAGQGSVPDGWICRNDLSGGGATPSPSPPPPAPVTLRIDGGPSSQRPQGQTFQFTGSGFTAGGSVTRHMRDQNGRETTLSPTLHADSRGNISWSFAATCATAPGKYAIWVIDDSTRRPSNAVEESVIAGSSCSPSLLIDGKTSSTRPQGKTFVFEGRGFTPKRTVTRWLRTPSGDVIVLSPTLSADASGIVRWSFTPSCSTPLGTYAVWIVSDATGQRSNTVTEIVTKGSTCP